jgi:micrococcal nuclease
LAARAPAATLEGVRRFLAVSLILVALGCGGEPHSATVDHVVDGDTVVLGDGRHVRLVQLDAPELDENECYARPAKAVLTRLVPPGTHVQIETDALLDRVDRFGRTLAYVWKDDTNVNLELVRAGAAAPWFFHGDRGRYAYDFLAAAREAQGRRRGLWSACPGTILAPLLSVDAER